ncbi:membrane-spanning 4-domains subfamily A member 3 [Sturnira hondurensis]|uniref:membrane-spanning 4-domains subfamily A member 3 n=1 Tax=Sturnira hondurensis TaxID=192404 RepID=UPI00187997D7|nr:membrane-spanning 4-domains subfamily A member 3 [Sturnira hondurensis]
MKWKKHEFRISVVAGRKPTRVWMENNCGTNVAGATITIEGFAFLSTNLMTGILCFNNKRRTTNPGLVFLMPIFTLMELCITVSVSVMGCKANCFSSREAFLAL